MIPDHLFLESIQNSQPSSEEKTMGQGIDLLQKKRILELRNSKILNTSGAQSRKRDVLGICREINASKA